jgi:hypothetical protein
MTGAIPPLRRSKQTDEMVARDDRIRIGAGMARTAAAVHFASSDAR